MQSGSHWANGTVPQGCVPSEALGKNPFPCLRQRLEATCISWSAAPFSISIASSIASSNLSPTPFPSSCLLFLNVTALPPTFTSQDPRDDTGLHYIITWIIQATVPHLRILNLIYMCKSLCHVRQHGHWQQGLGHGHI